MLWNRSFMISTCDTNLAMLIGNGQISKTGYESCQKLLFIRMVNSIEQKVFTFKRGLNIGRSTNRLLIQARSQKILLGGSFEGNVDLFLLQPLKAAIQLTTVQE